MKSLLLLLIITLLASCQITRPDKGCANWKDVQRHDRKPFRS